MLRENLHGDTLAFDLQQKGTRNVVFMKVPPSMILSSNSPLASAVSEARPFKPAPEKASLWAEALFDSSSTNTPVTSQPLPGNPAPLNVANEAIQDPKVTAHTFTTPGPVGK